MAQHAMPPVIASSSPDRSKDIVPYAHGLIYEKFDKFKDIFPSDFPRAPTREAAKQAEEIFLRQFFSEEDIHVQGGAYGAGNGFKFLKEVWMCIARWNEDNRVPLVTEWWFKENPDYAKDPTMQAYMLTPDAVPRTFFMRKELDLYGDKLLKVVVQRIQSRLRETLSPSPPVLASPPPLLEQKVPDIKSAPVSANHAATSADNITTTGSSTTISTISQDGTASSRRVTPPAVGLPAHPKRSEANAGNVHGNGQQHNSNVGFTSSDSNSRNTQMHPAQTSSRGNHSLRASGKPIYGLQDARSHAPPALKNHDHHVGGMPVGGASTQPRFPSAGSFVPGQSEYTPPTQPTRQQFVDQLPPISSGPVAPFYGHTPGHTAESYYGPQFQQHMPVNFPPGFGPGHSAFGPGHTQPARDYNKYTGRQPADESRLFDHKETSKSHRGSQKSGGAARRGSNSRGNNSFSRGGGNVAVDSPYYSHGARFDPNAQPVNDMRFSMPPMDRYWQPPRSSAEAQSENMMPYPGYEYPQPQQIMASPAGNNPALAQSSQQLRSTRGPFSHQRGPSIGNTPPCAVNGCNRYAIGEECTYAKKLVVSQIPPGMSTEEVENFFSNFGLVQAVSWSASSSRCWVSFVDASGARDALRQRGHPWVGGDALYVEVSGEHWDPESKHFAAPDGATFQACGLVPGTTNENYAGSGGNLAALGNEVAKKKKPNKNRPNKNTNKKKSGSRDGSFEESSKVNESAQNVLSKTAPSNSGPQNHSSATSSQHQDIDLKDVEPKVTAACASPSLRTSTKMNPSDTIADRPVDSPTTKDVVVVGEAKDDIGNEAFQTITSTTSCAPEQLTKLPLDSVESGQEAGSAPKDDTTGDISDGATVKPEDDQVDDSFHTASGSPKDGRDGTAPKEDVTTSTGDGDISTSNQPSDTNDHDLLTEEALSKITENDVEAPKPLYGTKPSSVSPTTLVDDAALLATDGGGLPVPADSPREKAAATTIAASTASPETVNVVEPEPTVTKTMPPADAQVSTSDVSQPGHQLLQTAQQRSASGNSTSDSVSLITAPNTPSIAQSISQVKSKKPSKAKGPATTESLSLFGKKATRKASGKKSKSTAGTSSGPQAMGAVKSDSPVPGVSQSGEATVSTGTVESNEKANISSGCEPAGLSGSDATVASDSPYGSLSDVPSSRMVSPSRRSGLMGNITNAVRTVLSMTQSPKPTPQEISSIDRSINSNDTEQQDAPLEKDIPVIQLNHIEESAISPTTGQDLDEQSGAGQAAGLGISDDTAEPVISSAPTESKPKKKKKSKNKKSKTTAQATAEVTITTNTLNNPRPSEPIYEFKGNDVASDSSSLTLGRGSPVSKRPSAKQIDEAKQPKPLLEHRQQRQIRSKKHNSVHSSKTSDSANSDDAAEPIPTMILPSSGDGILQFAIGSNRGRESEKNGTMRLTPLETPDEEEKPTADVEMARERLRKFNEQEEKLKQKKLS